MSRAVGLCWAPQRAAACWGCHRGKVKNCFLRGLPAAGEGPETEAFSSPLLFPHDLRFCLDSIHLFSTATGGRRQIKGRVHAGRRHAILTLPGVGVSSQRLRRAGVADSVALPGVASNLLAPGVASHLRRKKATSGKHQAWPAEGKRTGRSWAGKWGVELLRRQDLDAKA